MWKFPWTNFHELNLDWILKQVRELIDNVKELFDKLAEEIQNRKEGDEKLDTAVKAVDKKVDDTVAGMQNKTIPLPYVQLTGSVMEDGATVEMYDTQDNTRTVFSGAGMETSVRESTIGFGAVELSYGDESELYPGIKTNEGLILTDGKTGLVYGSTAISETDFVPALKSLPAASGILFGNEYEIFIASDATSPLNILARPNVIVASEYASIGDSDARLHIQDGEVRLTTIAGRNRLIMTETGTVLGYLDRNERPIRYIDMTDERVHIASDRVSINMNDGNDSGSLGAFTLHVKNDENEVAASMSMAENGMTSIRSDQQVTISTPDVKAGVSENHFFIAYDNDEELTPLFDTSSQGTYMFSSATNPNRSSIFSVEAGGIEMHSALAEEDGYDRFFKLLADNDIQTDVKIQFLTPDNDIIGHVGLDGAAFGIATAGAHILFSGTRYGKLTIGGQGIDLSPGTGTLTIGTKDKMFYSSSTKSTQFQHVTTDGTTSISMTDDGSINATTYFINLEADTRIKGQGLSYADGFSESTNPNMGDNRIPDMAWIKAYVAAELAKL